MSNDALAKLVVLVLLLGAVLMLHNYMDPVDRPTGCQHDCSIEISARGK